MSSPASEQKSSASTSSAKSASPVAEHDDGHRRTPSASSGTQRLSTHSVADVEAPALEAASSVPATAPRCESGVAVAATNWREGMDRADGPPAVLSSVRGSIMATAISHAPLLRYGRPQPPSPYSSRAPSLPSAPSWAPLSSGLRRHGTRQPISPSPPRDYSSLSPTPVKMAPEPYNPANLRPASLFGGIAPEAARPTYSYNRASTEAYVAAPTSVERPCEDSAERPAVGVSSVLDPSVEPQGLLRPPTPSLLSTAITGTQHAERKPAMAPLAGPPSPAETPLRLIDSNAAQSTPSHAKSHKDVVASPSAKAPNSAVVLAQLQAQLRAPLTIGGAAPLTTLDLSHVRLPEKEWSWLCQHILPRLTSLDVLRLCDVGLTDAMLGELIKYQSAFSSRTRREAARPRTAPAASSSSILQSTSATRDDECERRPPWRVVDVSSNHLTHRGATFLGRLLLRHAATLEELHARCNPFRDYGLQVLGVYLGKCSAESLKDEPYLFSAELRLAYRDLTTSCHAKEGEEDTQPVSRLAELLKKLHVGPSLLDLRECRASARGVSELLHGASKSHCLRTVLLTHNVPSPRGLLPSPSAEDGASSLNHCIITSGKLMEQPTFSQFLPLHHPAALRDVSLGGVPLSQLCSPAGCRSVLLGLLFCCPDLCVLDLSGTFTTELLPRPQLLDLLAEGTMEEQILQGAPPSPTSFDSWCQIVLAAERADEMPIVLDQLSVAGQSRVGDVLCELLSHAAFNAATTKKVVPSAFGHIKELHLASTGITDVAVRGLCRAVRNTTASWGLLQDLAVLNLADNLLTTLGCVEVIRCFIMDWPVASSGSCLEDLSVQGNAGVAEHDGQAMSVLGQSAHCAVSYRAADPCCTDSCGATGVRPLAIHYGLAGAQSPTHTVSCGRDGVVGSTVASSKAAGWADGIGLRTPHALHEVSSILEVSGRKAQELSSITDATGTMYPARRSLLRELEEQADEGETLVGSASHNVAEPTEVVELRPQRLVSPPSQMNDVESSTPAANFEVEIDEPNEQDAAQPPLVGQEEPTNTEQEHHTDTLPSPDHVQKRSASRETCSTVASRASSANRRTLSTEVLEGEAQQVPIGADVPKEVADLVALADDAMPQDGPCLDKDEEAPPMPSSPSPTTAAEVDEGANGGDAETATTMFPELSPPSTVPSPVGVGFSASPLPPGEAPSDPTSPPTPAERSMEVVVNPRPELAVVAPKSPTTVQQAVPMEVSTSPVLPSTADAGASPIEVTPKTSKPASPKQDAAEKLRKEQEAYERAAQQLRRQMMQNAYEGLLQKPQTSPDESSDHLLVAKGKWKGQQRVVLTIHQTTSLLMLSYEKKKLVGKNKQAVMLVHPLALGVRCGTSTEKSSKKEPQLLIHLTRPFLPEEVGVARAKVVAKVGEGAKDAGSSEGKALSAELLPREVDINITLSSLADLQAALATLKKEVSRAVEIFQTALPSPPAPRSATTSTPNPGATPSTAQSQSRAPQRRAPAAPSAATRKPS